MLLGIAQLLGGELARSQRLIGLPIIGKHGRLQGRIAEEIAIAQRRFGGYLARAVHGGGNVVDVERRHVGGKLHGFGSKRRCTQFWSAGVARVGHYFCASKKYLHTGLVYIIIIIKFRLQQPFLFR